MKIEVKLKLISGMMIASQVDPFEIGGVDKSTVTLDGQPYIPGSSLKGKLRREMQKDKSCDITDIFGGGKNVQQPNVKDNDNKIIVTDFYMVENNDKIMNNSLFEIKYENTIVDNQAKPRTNKRTIKGLEFTGEIIIINENINKCVEISNMIKKALESLAEKDYLGGNGSRGYGQFEIVSFKEINEKL